MKLAQRRAQYLLKMSKQLLRAQSGDPANQIWIDQVGYAMQYKHGPLSFAAALGILVSDSRGGAGEEIFIKKEYTDLRSGGVEEQFTDSESESESESLEAVVGHRVKYFLCKAGQQEKEALRNLQVLVVLGDAIWSDRPDVSTCLSWKEQTESKLEVFSKFTCPGYRVVLDRHGHAKYRPAWYQRDHLPRMIRIHPSPFLLASRMK